MMKNAERFVVGAPFPRFDKELKKKAASRGVPLKLADAAGGCRHCVKGADRRPVFIGGRFHCELPHWLLLCQWRAVLSKLAYSGAYGKSSWSRDRFQKSRSSSQASNRAS